MIRVSKITFRVDHCPTAVAVGKSSIRFVHSLGQEKREARDSHGHRWFAATEEAEAKAFALRCARGRIAELQANVDRTKELARRGGLPIDDPTSPVESVYTQRNALAIGFAKAALAAGWNAGRGYDDNDNPEKDWDPGWRHVVYVDLPDGRQVSWHMGPDVVHLLDSLPPYGGKWDGTYHGRDPSWCDFTAPGE